MFLKPLAAVTISSKDTNFGGDAAMPGIANPCAVFCLYEIKQNSSQFSCQTSTAFQFLFYVILQQ
jgi:hypothetical protein